MYNIYEYIYYIYIYIYLFIYLFMCSAASRFHIGKETPRSSRRKDLKASKP